jgi:hypothetical protein
MGFSIFGTTCQDREGIMGQVALDPSRMEMYRKRYREILTNPDAFRRKCAGGDAAGSDRKSLTFLSGHGSRQALPRPA